MIPITMIYAGTAAITMYLYLTQNQWTNGSNAIWVHESCGKDWGVIYDDERYTCLPCL